MQYFFDSWLLVRIVDTDRYEVESAVSVHAVHDFEGGQLFAAGTTPGCPEVDEHQLAGRVFAQRAQVVDRNRLYCHRFLFNLGQLFAAAFLFVQPLGGTADRGRFGALNWLAGQHGVDCHASVTPSHERLSWIVIDAALITEFSILIKDKDVWSCAGSVEV